MSQHPEVITLDAEEEAARLWAGALGAFERAGERLEARPGAPAAGGGSSGRDSSKDGLGQKVELQDRLSGALVSLCESLDLGLRAAEILVHQRLHPIKDSFPATIALQLQLPVPEVEPYRDAVAEPKALQMTEILDLLSAESLECVAPRMHRGWEDRRFSCRRSRQTAAGAVGLTLDAGDRDDLLLLVAYRNRLFRYPPPIRIVPAEILAAFPVLRRLVEGLAPAAAG